MEPLSDNCVRLSYPFQCFIFRPWGSPEALLELIFMGLGGLTLRALKMTRFLTQFWTHLGPMWALFEAILG